MLDNPTVKRPRGKQTCYTDELAGEICERLAAGETLSSICRDPHMPSSTAVRKWVLEDRDGFSSRYARGRDLLLEHLEDEILALSDSVLGTDNNAAVSAAKLASDNRKWLMSKLRPDKYGDRVDNRTTINLADPIAELLKQIAAEGRKVYDPRPT